MVSVALLSGLVIGLVATALVFVDTARRGFSPRSRLRWTGLAGGISLGGVLTAYVFDGVLYHLYLQLTDSPAIVSQPRAVAEAFLVIGLAAGALAVLTYGFASRYGPLKAT